MSILKTRQHSHLIPNLFATVFRFTHFLCFPLATPISRAQLQSSQHYLMRDPITRKIPDEAFVWPDTQVLNLGSLSLTSDSEIEAAKRLLGSLDLSGMLRKIRKRIADRTIPDLPKRSSGAHSEHPIRVSMIGLESSKHLQNTSKLYSPIINPEEVLSDYSKEIRRLFLESGLMHLDPLQTPDPRLHMPILRTDRLYTKEPETQYFETTPGRQGPI